MRLNKTTKRPNLVKDGLSTQVTQACKNWLAAKGADQPVRKFTFRRKPKTTLPFFKERS